jgi:hypothetical protein
MSTIAKTTFTFTVLHRSDEPLEDLSAAIYEASEGHAVGMGSHQTTVPVPDSQVPAELVALDNDGSFFDDDLDDAT